MKPWIRLLAFGLFMAALTVFLWLPYFKARGLIHPKRSPIDTSLESLGVTAYENVDFRTSDGLTLRGWYIPPQNNAVIIGVHGLGGNRTEYIHYVDFLTAARYGVLFFDLRNSGESDGTFTSLGLYEARDVHAAALFVQQKAGDSVHIILMGHSMGTSAVLLAAPELPRVNAVIVESAFTDIESNVADSVYALTSLPAFPFAPLVVFFGELQSGLRISAVRPIDAVPRISPRPLLIVHGALDGTLAVKNAYALFTAAKEPKELYIIKEAGHGNLLEVGGAAYRQYILSFLENAIH